MNATKLVLRALALVLAVCLGVGWNVSPVHAGDHQDAPSIAADPAADFGDLYAWHDPGTGRLNIVATFAGLAGVTANAPVLDSNVLYEIHIDNNFDMVPDITIDVRFGQNGYGDWGVQVLNMPGSAGPIVGPFGQALGTVARVYSGINDDPFFFDVVGFQQTVQTGVISFDNTRDFFAGRNVMAIALDMPLGAVNPSPNPTVPLSIWATSGRSN